MPSRGKRTPTRRRKPAPPRKPAPRRRPAPRRAMRLSPAGRAWLARVRAQCLALPSVTERVSHGAVTFFTGDRAFAYLVENHHGDGKLAVICAAPPGFQAMILETAPHAYYRPAYVGHRGWIGVQLDRGLPDGEVEAVLTQAHRAVARA